MKLISFLAFSIFISSASYGHSQDDLFIARQVREYRAWLKAKQLDKYMMVDTITVKNDQSVLQIKTLDMLNWDRLSHYIDSSFHVALVQTLFRRFVFQMDIDKNYGQVRIEGSDFLYIVRLREGQLVTDTLGKQGIGSDGKIVTITGISNPESKRIITLPGLIKDPAPKLTAWLTEYFKPFHTAFEKSQFDDLSDNDSSLTYTVSNITKAIMREGYFERLTLTFDLSNFQKTWRVQYSVEGKFAGGVIWSPQDSRYRPMTPDYQEAVDRFTLLLGNKIKKAFQ